MVRHSNDLERLGRWFSESQGPADPAPGPSPMMRILFADARRKLDLEFGRSDVTELGIDQSDLVQETLTELFSQVSKKNQLFPFPREDVPVVSDVEVQPDFPVMLGYCRTIMTRCVYAMLNRRSRERSAKEDLERAKTMHQRTAVDDRTFREFLDKARDEYIEDVWLPTIAKIGRRISDSSEPPCVDPVDRGAVLSYMDALVEERGSVVEESSAGELRFTVSDEVIERWLDDQRQLGKVESFAKPARALQRRAHHAFWRAAYDLDLSACANENILTQEERRTLETQFTAMMEKDASGRLGVFTPRGSNRTLMIRGRRVIWAHIQGIRDRVVEGMPPFGYFLGG